MSDASSGNAMKVQVALAIGAAIGAAATLWVAYYAFKPLPRSAEVGTPTEQAREGQLEHESEANGTSLPDEPQGFRWTQSHGEVQVLLQLPAAAKARNVDVVFQRGSLSISCMHQKLLDSELSAAIVTGDCGWQIEGSGGSRRLVVTLAKDLRDPKALLWKTLRKGDKEGFGFMHQKEFEKLM